MSSPAGGGGQRPAAGSPPNPKSNPNTHPIPKAKPFPQVAGVLPPAAAYGGQHFFPNLPEGVLFPSSSVNSQRMFPNSIRSGTDQLLGMVNSGSFVGRNPVGVHHIRGNMIPMLYQPVVDTRQPVEVRPRSMAPVLVVPKNAASGGGRSGGLRSVTSHPPSKSSSFPAVVSGSGPVSQTDLRGSSVEPHEGMVTIVKYDRKVRLVDGAPTSLYALCRSWVWNAMPQELRPHPSGGLGLPKPLPASMNASASENAECDEEGSLLSSNKQTEESVDDLSSRELLELHIKRAKKVRARFKAQRLQRIDRYKQRLALLLPTSAEQSKNDVEPGG